MKENRKKNNGIVQTNNTFLVLLFDYLLNTFQRILLPKERTCNSLNCLSNRLTNRIPFFPRWQAIEKRWFKYLYNKVIILEDVEDDFLELYSQLK